MKTLLRLAFLVAFTCSLQVNAAEKLRSIAMHGTPKYADGFTHFDYVNPDAPKGGKLRLHAIGGFDSLHPFIIQGRAPVGIGLIYDTLTMSSQDEPFTHYGLLAQTFEIPEDRSYVVFHLHPKARFSDGKPVTADDVIFSFNILITKGSPLYRGYYADVDSVTASDSRTVRFDFKKGVNRELALIIGQLPVFPRHFWQDRDFAKPTLDIPTGSGPYIIDSVDVNKKITYKRNPDYWGKDLPVNKGMYNFATISYQYYLDQTVALEAFKSGDYDYRQESTSSVWATEYDFAAVKQGKIKVEEVPHGRPTGMQAFVYNLRRSFFQDIRVREALAYAFDFEWSNANLFFGAYTRTDSFFSNSSLASSLLPSAGELRYLAPLKEQVPARVFTSEYQPPRTDGSGQIRGNLKKAIALLRDSGWTFKDGKLVDKEGSPFVFEILIVLPSFERVVNPFVKNLSRLGIEATVRLVDTTQYINRVRSFDFDMVIGTFAQSASPGNEQRDFWHSRSANVQGSRNLAGIQNPAVDVLIDNVIQAESRQELEFATRSLDRILLWNFYVIPQWHINKERIAYWNQIRRPEITPTDGVVLMSWWANQ